MFGVWELFKARPTTDKEVDVAGLTVLIIFVFLSK
jgi:hypothetical protein